MFAVRLHGRGGQGIVTTAELLAIAVFHQGEHAQAFPTFGSERTGAPVAAYCRIDRGPIRTHEPIIRPDAVIVADPTLFDQVNLLAGLCAGGLVLVNGTEIPGELRALRAGRARAVAVRASEIAYRHLGRPLPGVPLLGAFAALTGRVGLPALFRAVTERLPKGLAEGNVAAAQEAYEAAKAYEADAAAGRKESAHA
jgi:pyruvate ferredoxin oxidoreductase gamma subunit